MLSSKRFRMDTHMYPLPRKSYTLAFRGGGRNAIFGLQNVLLSMDLENPNSNDVVHIGPTILSEQMAYKPTLGQRLP